MSELILKMSITIDGFVAAKHDKDWIFRSSDDASKGWVLELVRRAGYHAMGTKAFREMAMWWPTSKDMFAAPMNDIPKLVFSRGGEESRATTKRVLDEARQKAEEKGCLAQFESWANARFVTGDLTDEIGRIKKESAKPIVAYGGAELAQQLVKLGLIDEYRLPIHPVALGTGLPLFSQLDGSRDLKLIDVTRFEAGAVAHVYRRVS
jgi:dihydrofolate reductase